MKAFEVMGKVDEKGQLLLDKPLEIYTSSHFIEMNKKRQ